MATNVQISNHYNGTVKIKFYPDSHRYQLDGRRDFLIGVTTATGKLDKSNQLLIWAERLVKSHLLKAINEGRPVDEELINEAIEQRKIRLEEAATIGSLVHGWAEQFIKKMNPAVPEDPRVKNGVVAFLRWIRENDVKFTASEVRIFSKKHEYVGTMDTVFTMGREDHKILHAGDFKTGSGIYIDQAFQVSAYQQAHNEEHGTEFGSKWILRFFKEDKFDDDGTIKQRAGDFEAKEFDLEEHEGHFKGFLGLLEVKKQDKVWEAKHGFYSKKKAFPIKAAKFKKVEA